MIVSMMGVRRSEFLVIDHRSREVGFWIDGYGRKMLIFVEGACHKLELNVHFGERSFFVEGYANYLR